MKQTAFSHDDKNSAADSLPMSRGDRIRTWISLIAGLYVIIRTVWCVSVMFFYRGTGNMTVNGAIVFRYFTVDSNILWAAACLASLPAQILSLMTGKNRVSYGLLLLRYVSAAAVTLTLMTVLFFLGPIYGYPSMFAGMNFYLHLVGPVLGILCILLLDPPVRIRKEHFPLSVLPMILYGAVYLYFVVAVGQKNGGWPDFYAFNVGGRWPISLIAMLAAMSLIGYLLMLSRNKIRCRSHA